MLAAMAMMSVLAEPDLRWMAGNWVGDVWGGRMEERWTEQEGGTLLGLNRVVVDKKTVHREYLAVDVEEGKATMTVFLVRNKSAAPTPVSFPMTEAGKSHAVFANPEHERLSRITYRRDGGTLHIRLEGKRSEKSFREDIVLRLAK